MKKVLVGAAVVLTLATMASAAQVQLFLSSPQATNGAVSGPAAYAAQANPALPAGPANATVELWMALNAGQLGNIGILGGTLDVLGSGSASGSATSALAVQNAGAGLRWTSFANGPVGVSPLVWGTTSFLRGAALALNPDDNGNAIAGISLYKIAVGTISYGAADGQMFIEFPVGGAIGTNDAATGTAGVSFGWATGGGPDLSSFSNDSDGGGTPGANPPFDPANPQYGWTGAALGGAPVVSLIPDLTIAPEPTTLALLGLAGLFIRRRR